MASNAKYKTCRRHNEPGHAHALTFCCFRGRPFLSKDRTRSWFLESLAKARDKHRFNLWTYVIMPEHVHLVIFPRERNYSISKILADIKQPVTRRTLRYLREHSPSYLTILKDAQPSGKVAYRFWQRGGGYDRNLLDPASISATIEYIHANPVRRQLVAAPEDWLWSSARYYAGKDHVILGPDADSLPQCWQ